MSIETDIELLSEAKGRYLLDAEFHAAVDTAVAVAITAGEANTVRDLATQAAAMALVIHEGDVGTSDCTCTHPTVDVATLSEREPRPIPACACPPPHTREEQRLRPCACDQEPYQ